MYLQHPTSVQRAAHPSRLPAPSLQETGCVPVEEEASGYWLAGPRQLASGVGVG